MILKKGEMQMNNFIGELHKLFDIINKDKFDGKLIEPVITVSREKSKSKKKIIFGWCTLLPIWTKVKDGKETQHHEINMTIDYIDRPLREVLGTFVHELVHLYNTQNNISDCSRKQYHNEKFKDVAEKLGLVVEKSDTGWSQTSVSDELWKYLEELNEKELINFDNLTIKKTVGAEKQRKPVNRKPIYKYKCPECGREIKSKFDDLQVHCNDCDEDFEIIEK
jgi:hypothetical protein